MWRFVFCLFVVLMLRVAVDSCVALNTLDVCSCRVLSCVSLAGFVCYAIVCCCCCCCIVQMVLMLSLAPVSIALHAVVYRCRDNVSPNHLGNYAFAVTLSLILIVLEPRSLVKNFSSFIITITRLMMVCQHISRSLLTQVFCCCV